MNIFVNTRPCEFNESKISYYQILQLSQKKGNPTVVISYPKQDKKSRTLIEGQFADVFEGMVIDCHRTDSA